MSGLYTHTARITGESIDETKYNSDHQNHIDNHIPEMMDDYSSDASEMQSETDPGEDGSESLATSLAEELERLRYAIRELKGTTYWYETAPVPLAQIDRTNYLINGAFEVWQRGTSFTDSTTPANDDNTFVADGWRLLSDGNDVVDIARGEDGPSESDTSLKATIVTTNTKWGICQFVEDKDSIKLSAGNQKAVFRFTARCSSGATATRLRAAIIQWTGSANACTTDIVSAWEAEGTNPTLVANWAYASTPSTLTLTSSLTSYEIDATLISDSATNVGVFIWMDDTSTAAGEFIILAAARLVRGFEAAGSHYSPEPFSVALARCQRRFVKTYPYGSSLGAATLFNALTCRADTNANLCLTWDFPVTMMTTPDTVTLYNPSTGSTAEARNVTDSTDVSALGTSHTGDSRTAFQKAGSGGVNAGDLIAAHATAEVDF